LPVALREANSLLKARRAGSNALPPLLDNLHSSPGTTPSGTYHIVSHNGLALDIVSESVAKESYPLKALKLNRCAFQKWRIERRDLPDVFAIRWDGAQPRVLQPEGDVKPKARVLTALPGHREQEHWILRSEPRTGIYAIVHQSSGLALTLSDEDSSVILDQWKDEERQHWLLIA